MNEANNTKLIRINRIDCEIHERKSSGITRRLRELVIRAFGVLICIVPAVQCVDAGASLGDIPEIPEWLTPGYTSGITADQAREWIRLLPPEEQPGLTSKQISEIRGAKFSRPLDALENVPDHIEVNSYRYVGPSRAQQLEKIERRMNAEREGFGTLPDHYIVRFRDNAFPYRLGTEALRDERRVDTEGYTVDARAAELTELHDGELYRVWNYGIAAFSAWLTEEAAASIESHNLVDYVEENTLTLPDVDQEDPPSWGLKRIHNENMPIEDVYRYFFDGDGVTAYIFDTGLRTTHNDLPNQGAHYDAYGTGIDDPHGHGTQIAGVIGGQKHGVAKGATIFAVKVFESTIDICDLVEGIEEVLLIHDISDLAVANFSLSKDSQTFDDMIEQMLVAGIVVVTSAGNDGTDDIGHLTPNNRNDVLTVGAIDDSDTYVSPSNYGSYVDIYAPGRHITTTYIRDDDDTVPGASGTSIATPHVAGVAARYLQGNPTVSAGTVVTDLINQAVTGKISSLPSGSHNRMLFRTLWWYPYHSFDEWDASDTEDYGNHTFYSSEFASLMWTNDVYYPWFYRYSDDKWLEYLTPDPFLTFWRVDDIENPQNGNIEAYSYWEEVP